MPVPILSTKLHIPPPRPSAVLRSRLIGRLNAGLHSKLILVSAAAGCGKTTLISAWLAGRGDGAPPFPAAWLSLDRGDSDPARFLTYLVVALQTISAGVGAGILAALASPQPPPTESLLSTLSNEITTIPHNFILVLDDYHLIDATLVDQALTFLIEHQPPQMHLVIATREDPQLPVSRYRARGQMTELRAADLRFTPAEAAEFLNQVMGLSLSLFPRHHGDHHTLRDWPQPGYFGSGFVGRTAFWTLGLAFGVIFLAALLIIGVPYLMATVA